MKKPQKLTESERESERAREKGDKSKLDALCEMPSKHYQRSRFEPKKKIVMKTTIPIFYQTIQKTNFSLVYMYTAK